MSPWSKLPSPRLWLARARSLISEPGVCLRSGAGAQCGFNRNSKENQAKWEKVRDRQQAREEEALEFERNALEKELATLQGDNHLAGKVKSGAGNKEKEKLLVQLEEVRAEVSRPNRPGWGTLGRRARFGKADR